MSEQSATVKSHEQSVDPETVNRLKRMTDQVLEDLGFPAGEVHPVPVVKFTVTKPTNPDYKLTIHSIADGEGGYNTFFAGDGHPEDDNSRRWSVDIDRGKNSVGTAYDDKGAVYEHGGYDPRTYAHQNINTGTIDELIADFDDNPEGTVVAELIRFGEGQPTVEFGPVPLHPTTAAEAPPFDPRDL
jgi:hypothetical protein